MCGCSFVNNSKIFTEKPWHDISKFCLHLVSLKVVSESEGKSGHKGFSKIQFFVFFKKKKEGTIKKIYIKKKQIENIIFSYKIQEWLLKCKYFLKNISNFNVKQQKREKKKQ